VAGEAGGVQDQIVGDPGIPGLVLAPLLQKLQVHVGRLPVGKDQGKVMPSVLADEFKETGPDALRVVRGRDAPAAERTGDARDPAVQISADIEDDEALDCGRVDEGPEGREADLGGVEAPVGAFHGSLDNLIPEK